MEKQYNGRQWLFGYNIPQNIVFCVQQEKETHTGTEQVKGE